MPRTRLSRVSRSPTSELLPTSRFKTPGGRPARSNISTSLAAVSGVVDDGLKMTVLPATRAGAIFQAGMQIGKFQGVIKETTPSGCRMVYAKFFGSSDGIVI